MVNGGAPRLGWVRASRADGVVRTVAGGPMLRGFAAIGMSILTGPRGETAGQVLDEAEQVAIAPEPMTGVFAWLQRAIGVLDEARVMAAAIAAGRAAAERAHEMGERFGSEP